MNVVTVLLIGIYRNYYRECLFLNAVFPVKHMQLSVKDNVVNFKQFLKEYEKCRLRQETAYSIVLSSMASETEHQSLGSSTN